MNESRTDLLDVLAGLITVFGLVVIGYGVGWGEGGDALLGLFVTALGVGVAAWSKMGR